MTNYYFNVDENNIVTESAAAGEFMGAGWIYSGTTPMPPGYYYNADLKKCYALCRYPSWTLDPITCSWVAPIPKPQDNSNYIWNEDAQNWDVMDNVPFKLPYELILPAYDIP